MSECLAIVASGGVLLGVVLVIGSLVAIVVERAMDDNEME